MFGNSRSRLQSRRPIGGLAVDQPAHSKPIDDHAETHGPKRLFDRHDRPFRVSSSLIRQRVSYVSGKRSQPDSTRKSFQTASTGRSCDNPPIIVLQSWEEDSERARWLAIVSIVVVIALGRALQIANGDPRSRRRALDHGRARSGGLREPWSRGRSRSLDVDCALVALVALSGSWPTSVQLYTETTDPGLAAFVRTRSRRSIGAWPALSVRPRPSQMFPSSRRWSKGLQVGALVAAHFALGVWTIHQSPCSGHRRSSLPARRHQRRFVDGTNPYSAHVPEYLR